MVAVGSAVSTVLIWRQIDQTKAEKFRAEENLDTAYKVLDEIYLDAAEKRLPQQDALTPEDRQFLKKALYFYERFALQQGTDPGVRQKTAQAYLRVANIQMQLGQIEDSRENFDQALALFDRLVTEFPDHPDYRQNLARCHSDMGYAEGYFVWDSQERVEAFRQAVALQEKLTSEFREIAAYQRDLAESYGGLGNQLSCRARFDEAEKVLRRALAICTELTEEHPTELIYWLDLSNNLGFLGQVLLLTDRLEEAEKIFRRSLDLRKELVSDYPRLPLPRFIFGWGYQNLAGLLEKTGKLKEAEESYRQALVVRAKLIDDYPGVSRYRRELLESQRDLANVLKQMGRFEEAAQVYKDALAVFKNLVRDHPAVLGYQQGLAYAHCLLGELYRATGQPKEAEQAYKRVLLLTEGPAPPNLRIWHALSLAYLKEHARAMSEADTLAQAENADGYLLYGAACVYALSAAAVGNDSEQTERYAARAVELLGRAVAKGWKDAVHMKKDNDLDSLRQRKDFRKLLNELEEKRSPEKQLSANP